MAGFKSNIRSTWPSYQTQQQQQPRDSVGRFTSKPEEDLIDTYLRRRTLIEKLPITTSPQFVQGEAETPVEDIVGSHLSRCIQHIEKIKNLPKDKPAYLRYYLFS